MREAKSARIWRLQPGVSPVKLVYVLMDLLEVIFKHVSKPTNPPHLFQCMTFEV
jgi:hypothetical protein